MAKEFKYEITKRIATLKEAGYRTKELNMVSYDGAAPKYDLRVWMHFDTGLKMGDRHPDADEFLDVELIPLKDLVTEVLAGRIPDAKTQIAVLKAAAHEGILK